MRERDITSTLRWFAEGIYVGSQMDEVPGAVRIDVRELSEAPMSAGVISRPAVDVYMRSINNCRLIDKEVLVSCTYGVNRAPAIAKLYCIGKGLRFNWVGSFPNSVWRDFINRNYAYYQRRSWA